MLGITFGRPKQSKVSKKKTELFPETPVLTMDIVDVHKKGVGRKFLINDKAFEMLDCYKINSDGSEHNTKLSYASNIKTLDNPSGKDKGNESYFICINNGESILENAPTFNITKTAHSFSSKELYDILVERYDLGTTKQIHFKLEKVNNSELPVDLYQLEVYDSVAKEDISEVPGELEMNPVYRETINGEAEELVKRGDEIQENVEVETHQSV